MRKEGVGGVNILIKAASTSLFISSPLISSHLIFMVPAVPVGAIFKLQFGFKAEVWTTYM